MQRKELYNEVVDAFEQSYSWLGKQFAEEMMLSLASWNVQTFSNPNFRARRHMILFWAPSWFKSTLLNKTYHLLGPELCTIMTDVSHAALRGTVESGQFVSPFTLKRPFSICTEFGQVLSGADSTEIVQKLLNILEEGLVTVSLGKISYLSPTQREEIKDKYGITFIDNNTFTYHTNWVLMAGTYNRRFLVDNALESRFNIVYPEKRLDAQLTKYVINSRPFMISDDVINGVRNEILRKTIVNCNIKLPDEVFDENTNITPRESAGLLSTIICRAWWGLKTDKEYILKKIDNMRLRSKAVWMTADDKVFEAIEQEAKTATQIAEETGLSKRQVYYSLKSLRASRYIDEEGNATWRVL